MPYIEGRTAHDADSHVMETPDWLVEHAEAGIRERIPALYLATTRPGEETLIQKLRRKHADPEYRARDAEELMQRKNWAC